MLEMNLLAPTPSRRSCIRCSGPGPFYGNLTVCASCRNREAKLRRDADPERSRAYSRKYHANNKEKCHQQFAVWYAATPEHQKRRRRQRGLQYYGLTVETFEALFISQHGHCLLRGGEMEKQGTGKLSVCVDHDHATGKVRGLLHRKCNNGLGFFDDDVALLKLAVQYMERNR